MQVIETLLPWLIQNHQLSFPIDGTPSPGWAATFEPRRRMLLRTCFRG